MPPTAPRLIVLPAVVVPLVNVNACAPLIAPKLIVPAFVVPEVVTVVAPLSVVPPVTPEVVRFVREQLTCEPIVVGPGIKTGVAVKTSDPAAVGADRIVNAAAVKVLYGAPALVIDFGTATTFDYVNAHGDYEGGIIAPGPALALDGLVRNTAKLPRIELVVPKHVVGKNTVSAMQSGVVLGYLCMVEGLIEKIVGEVGPIPHVIATGGLGKLFSDNSKKINSYEYSGFKK